MCFRIVILLVLYLPNLYYCNASRKGEKGFTDLFVMFRATIVLEQIEQARAKKRVSMLMERVFFSVLFLVLYDLCHVYVAVGSGGLRSSRQLRTIFYSESWVRKLANKAGQVNKTITGRTALARASRGIVE